MHFFKNTTNSKKKFNIVLVFLIIPYKICVVVFKMSTQLSIHIFNLILKIGLHFFKLGVDRKGT